ncbi:unnamed protein product [Leptosia nina]|uniref:Uncharacterized protein n=1 Tax=Leptosia nina TaxID=320188 RepID=A0AAV1K583_9NEOP
MGQNLALQLPPFVLSPVVVLPSINQEQSINIQTNENNEEAFEQDDFPEKLIKPFCNTTGNLDSAVNDPDNVREINNSTELAESEDANLDKDMFRQNTMTSNNPVTESNINDKESTTITSGDIIATSAKIDGIQTTAPPGFYPTAVI